MTRARRKVPGQAATAAAPTSEAPEKDVKADATPTRRTRRRSFGAGGGRLKLGVVFRDEDFHKKWHPAWLNDTRGNLQEAVECGYEFVAQDEIERFAEDDVHGGNTDLNSKVSRVVGTKDGEPIRAYLLKIRMEWYLEDLAARERDIVDVSAERMAPGDNLKGHEYGEVRIE